MRIVEGLSGLRSLPAGAVVSVGNFDGLHCGHARILEVCRRRAGEAGTVALVTFEPHPLTVLRPELAPPRLTPPALKEALLQEAGADYLVILPPEPAVLNLTAERFWGIVRDEARPAAMVEGDEFTFGKDRGGTIDTLRKWTAEAGIAMETVPPVRVALSNLAVVRVSSSLIRWLLGHGRVRDAAICLGRPYTLGGTVVMGKQRGRGLGVPTANLKPGEQLIPSDGVYAGRCRVAGVDYPAATSIGTLPTFGDCPRTIEAHLVGFSGDLYGQGLHLELLDWIRDQRKFASVDALKAQLTRDIQWTVERK